MHKYLNNAYVRKTKTGKYIHTIGGFNLPGEYLKKMRPFISSGYDWPYSNFQLIYKGKSNNYHAKDQNKDSVPFRLTSQSGDNGKKFQFRFSIY